jgi:ComF family protein
LECGRVGSYLCADCVGKIEYLPSQICSTCYKNAISGKTHPKCRLEYGIDGVISIYSYKGPIKKLIKSLKYRFNSDIINSLRERISLDKDLLPAKSWCLIPIPLYKTRQNFRGFNQAELLGQLVAEKLSLTFDSTILNRKLNTKSQISLSQKQRKENVENIFELKGEVFGKSFYLFDDVWTSGATLKSAAKVLKKAGAKNVWGLTLAHPR